LANRWFDYNTFGSGSAGRIGLKWQPTHDLLLRATYSEGFRAPTIVDLDQGLTDGFSDATDPCDASKGQRTGTVAANCAAQGVPVGYTQLNSQIRSTAGGSATLAPLIENQTGSAPPPLGTETSKSKTVGFVYSPSWAPGLNVNVDYYHIKLTNTIQSLGAQNIVNFCYNSKGLSSPYCALMSRSKATHNINTIINAPQNIGGTLTSGFDGGIGYHFPATSFGNFSAKLLSTYVQRYDLLFPGEPIKHAVGKSGPTSPLDAAVPRDKTKLAVDWTYRGFHAAVLGHYVSHTTESCLGLQAFGICTYPKENKNNVGAVTWWDAQLTYDFLPINTSVTLGARNLFNREPSLTTNGGYDVRVYGPLIGRLVYLRVSARF
jgi:iron complex outermembrane receptor protein